MGATNKCQESRGKVNKPIRILLVDDSPYFLEAARDFLHLQKYLTVVGMATEGDEAIAQSQNLQPDIILLDLNLAHSSGLRLIPVFKENLPGIRIIVLTMMEESSYRAAAMESGADGFVHKSVMSKTLITAIREAMERADPAKAAMEDDRSTQQAGQGEARFLRLAEQLPDLIYRYEISPKRGFSYVSPSASAMTGYTPEEHYADPDLGFKLVLPEDRPILEAAAQGKIDPAQPIVLRWVRKDGTIIWTEQRNVSVFNEAGELTAIEGIARDSTAGKQAEEALRESEDKFKYIFDHSALGKSLTLPDGQLNVNQAFCEMLGYSLEELKSGKWQEITHPDDIELSQREINLLLSGEKDSARFIKRYVHKNGSVVWADVSTSLRRDKEGAPLYFMTVVSDITERKNAEETLREKERLLSEAQRIASLGSWEVELATGKISYSEEMYHIFGISAEKFSHDTQGFLNLIHPDDLVAMQKWIEETLAGGDPGELDFRIQRPDGSIRFVRGRGEAILDGAGRPIRAAGTAQDITARKRAEDAVRASQERYRDLVENIHDLICTHDLEGVVLSVNQAVIRLTGYAAEEIVGRNLRDLLPPKHHPTFDRYLADIQRDGAAGGLMTVLTKSGESRVWEYQNTLRTEGVLRPIVRGYARDITDQRRAESALRASEERYRLLFLSNPHPMWVYDLETLRFLAVNDAAVRHYGYAREEFLAMTIADIRPSEDLPRLFENVASVTEGLDEAGCWRHRKKDGAVIDVEITSHTLDFDGRKAEVVLTNDVTDRRQAEQALRESETRYRAIFDGVQDAILVESPDGKVVATNDRACEMYGYSRAELLTKTVDDLVPEDHARLLVNGEARKLSPFPLETVNCRADGTTFPIEIFGRLQTINGEEVMLVVVRDISERKRVEQEIERQLERLKALHAIDRAIGGGVDLRTNLNILLGYVVSLLNVDAADILLASPQAQAFEFAAGRGFHTRIAENARVPFGRSLAGAAALQRKAVRFSGQLEADVDEDFTSLWVAEGFVSYVGVPLIARGQLKGVLEIYQRSRLVSDPQWDEFLDTLAGQAAIAIDNAQMFTGLQQSNVELSLAYDATIEGWSRAMDLRDKETEGHTQRVTDLTLKLARQLGVPEEQLIHYRRGGLLHDIGKMGVPDNILLKEGPLTDEEWEIMRQHPTFARDMLAPIRYLRGAARDIPYCHHEKWDGTGYPQGLKGGQIPLSARIFAVVDVWDALTSDRPYRPAWTREKTSAYLREQSGKHFDPEIVKAFLYIIADVNVSDTL